MSLFLIAQSNIPIIGPIIELIARGLGFVMEAIYNLFNMAGVESIALSIIIFTIIVRICMLPLFVKQQKFSRLNMIMQPEMREVQNKYKGKRDNESMMAMQAETKAIYQKYGTSPSGSCLQLLVQLPILWAVYLIIRNIPSYVGKLGDLYNEIYVKLSTSFVDSNLLTTVKSENIANLSADDRMHTAINNMAVLNSDGWNAVHENFIANGGTEAVFANAQEHIIAANNFLGIDLSISAWNLMQAGVILAIAIPIISAVAQFFSMRLSMARSKKMRAADQRAQNQADPMGSSMKTMNFIMPLFSLWIGFTLPTGVALYWMIGSIVQIVIQILVNRHMDKIGIEKIIEKNLAKAEKKRKKKKDYVDATKVASSAQMNTRKLSNAASAVNKTKTNDKDEAPRQFKEGSLAAKANLVSQVKEKNINTSVNINTVNKSMEQSNEPKKKEKKQKNKK